MEKIYYSPQGYWKGITAIKKLSKAAGVSELKAKEWLKKQAIWQIYLPAPKKIIRPKFENYIPNDTHQIDLLYLPYDKIGKKKYKYALTVVDLATRYKDAEPLTERSSNTVAMNSGVIQVLKKVPYMNLCRIRHHQDLLTPL